jgi:hypothetical protein
MKESSEKELEALIQDIEKETQRMGSSVPTHIIPTLVLLAKIVSILGKRANKLAADAERLNRWIMILTAVLCILTFILTMIAFISLPPLLKRLFP